MFALRGVEPGAERRRAGLLTRSNSGPLAIQASAGLPSVARELYAAVPMELCLRLQSLPARLPELK